LETGGLATLNSLAVTGDANLASTLETGGLATLNSLAVTNNAAIGGAFTVTGVSHFTGTLNGTNAIFTGSVQANNFIGTVSGGSINWGSSIVPLANGGTGYAATSTLDLLNYLGGTNASNLSLGTLPAGRIAAGEITSAMMAAPDVASQVGPYFQVYVDSAGRVVSGSSTIPIPSAINDGNGESIVADNNGLTFTTSNVARIRINMNGNIGIGSTAANVSLDLSHETDALALPSGTTAQRPGSPVNGDIRYNNSVGTRNLEAYVNGAWSTILTSGGGGTTITSGVILGTSATATNPQRDSDAATGFYSPGVQQVAVSAGGVEVMQWNTIGSGADYLSITPGLSGTPPSIAVVASTPNQNLDLTPASGGNVNLTTGALYLEGNNGIWQDTTNFNLAVGATALPTTVSGIQDTAVGYQALNANTTGNVNTALGYSALSSNTTGSGNTAVGGNALFSNTTGGSNNAFGGAALANNTTGSQNSAFGARTLIHNTTGSGNTAVGGNALSSNTIGSGNTAFGVGAMHFADTGSENVAVGDGTLTSNLADNEVAVGSGALRSNSTGSSNTALGYQTLTLNTIGSGNTAVGASALFNNSTGVNNTAVGLSALNGNTEGSYNAAFGLYALLNNTSGGGNTALGEASMITNTAGQTNTAVGADSLRSNTAGSNNTTVGDRSLLANTTGNNNTAIGYNVASTTLATGSNNILIGTSSNVDTPAANTNNFLNIGNVVFATGMTGTVASPAGNVGIGSTAPQVSLDMSLRTDALALPSGLLNQRPSGINGEIRYSQTNNAIEAYIDGVWENLLTSGGSTATITLGTSAAATNPQRNGEAGTGLFSATSGTVSVAASGADVVDFNSSGLNLLGTVAPGSSAPNFKVNGNNAIWQDATNFNLAVGATGFPVSASVSGGAGSDVAVGPQALNVNLNGTQNTAVGTAALQHNTNGSNNSALGNQALSANTTGNDNTAIGNQALINATTTTSNTAVGSSALQQTTTGSWNTAIGTFALNANTTGQKNTALGFVSLTSNTTGANNSALGYGALNLNTTGVDNTAFGYQAGHDITTGGHNVIIGDYATTGVGITTGSNNILIGQDLQKLTQTSSNLLDIGNLIFATGLTSGTTMSTGNVGIGTSSPTANLSFSGTAAQTIHMERSASGAGNTLTVQAGAAASGNGGDLILQSGVSNGTSKASIQFQTSACPPLTACSGGDDPYAINMFIQGSTGNVGIGSTAPLASLDISQKTDAVSLPSGTTAQRPATGVNGMIRYNGDSGITDLEAYINGSWQQLVATGNGGSTPIYLGTSASATNPQRNGEAGTGLFSANSGQVSIAATGTDYADFASTGLNLPVATETLKIGGNNAVWQDATNNNLAVGPTAFPSTVSQAGGPPNGQANTAVGAQALNANTTGNGNTAIGPLALQANTTGAGNTAVGEWALQSNTTGINNIGLGVMALLSNTTGISNVALGNSALNQNTTASNNTAVGQGALKNNVTGGSNTAVGSSALSGGVGGSASANTAIGAGSLAVNVTGINNTAVGFQSLLSNSTGVNNAVLGYRAGFDVTTGGHNIIIGDYTTTGVGVTTGSNNILIGQDVRPASQTASNQMNIGNLIYATSLASGSTASTGNVGIGTSSPGYALDVNGVIAQRPAHTNSVANYLQTNAAASAATVDLNPGVLIFSATGFKYGMDLGFGSSRYRTRLFAPSSSDIVFSTHPVSTDPTAQSNFTDLVVIRGDTGNVGIGSTTPVASLDLSQKTDAVSLPSGTSAQRPGSPVNGMVRYSQSNSALEGYINGAWETLITGTGTTSTITLGTSASATNPQRSGEAGTGLFSANSGQVSVAATGTDYADFASAGLNLPVATESYKINGNNAVWQDANSNLALGNTAMPTTVSQAGGGNNGKNNIALGSSSLNANTTGYQNIAIGTQALTNNITGYQNIAIGYQAMFWNTTGQGNTAIGNLALLDNQANGNTAVGSSALQATSTGANNTGIGSQALGANTTGANNTALGASALITNTTGSQNTALGVSAMSANTTGASNVAAGYQSLFWNSTGTQNVAIGNAALFHNGTGAGNTGLGYQAGYDMNGGSQNIIIGAYPTNGVGITTGSNNILIGYDLQKLAQTSSNQLDIGNLIFATGLGSGSTMSTGQVGIGTTSPAASLDVNGDIDLKGTAVLSLSSNTLNVGSTYIADTSIHHIAITGSTPTVSTGGSDCGTSPSIVGNDNVGFVTVGSSSSGTTCTITFAHAWTTAPVCIAQDNTTEVTLSAPTTTTTVVIGAPARIGNFADGDQVAYHCIGYAL
jgi:hypothetical protein